MTAVFAYRNYVDDPDCVLSPTVALVDGYPIDNLKIRGLGDPVVFDSDVAELLVEFSSERTMHVVAALGGGMASANIKRLVVEVLPAGGGFWDTRANISLRDNCRLLGETGMMAIFPEGLTLAIGEKMKIKCYWFDDLSSIAQARIGRLWLGPALLTTIATSWSLGFRDSGSLDATDGQNVTESKGVRTRVLSVAPAGPATTRDMYGFDDGDTEVATDQQCLQGIQMLAGTTGEVIVVPRADTDLWTHRTGVYGHIESPFAISHASGPYWQSGITVVEER